MATGRTWRLGPPLVLALFLGAAAVSYFGTRGGEPGPVTIRSPAPGPTEPVVSITLPQEDVEIPPGPNREQFRVACTVCHSPRLAFTQPRFGEKKWAEVVHKMVAVYGAPIPAADEPALVAYLTAVRGKP
jgi:hypothetical protein